MLKSSFALVATASVLCSLAVGLLGPIYPIFVVDRFSASFLDLGVLYAIFGLTAAIFKVPAGKLVDIHGERKVFLTSVFIGAICSLSYAFAFNLAQLYIIEFLSGFSYALQRPAFVVLVVNISEKSKRGLFLGVTESVYDAAAAIGALLSTAIVSALGFESLFLTSFGCQAATGFFMLKIKSGA
ncbi:MAG: MFS transporter [Candidatus Bathyarchaeia archaeon]